MGRSVDDPDWSNVALRDVLYLRKVRNLHSVRAEAGNLSPIGLTEHLRWYSRNARWIRDHSYIVFVGARRAGYVRLGPITFGQAEISIAIEPWAQGRGLGFESLRWALARYTKIAGLEVLTAQVHRENVRSLAIFTRAGFVVPERPGEQGNFLLTKSLGAEAR